MIRPNENRAVKAKTGNGKTMPARTTLVTKAKLFSWKWLSFRRRPKQYHCGCYCCLTMCKPHQPEDKYQQQSSTWSTKTLKAWLNFISWLPSVVEVEQRAIRSVVASNRALCLKANIRCIFLCTQLFVDHHVGTQISGIEAHHFVLVQHRKLIYPRYHHTKNSRRSV